MALSVALSSVTASDATFSAAGATAWLTVKDRTATLSGIASAAQGGTGIAYFAVAGPSAERIYTFPDSAATILYSGGALGTPASGTLTNATGLPEAGLTIADNTTANVSITAHGFAPKAPNVATQFLNGTGAWSTPDGGATLDGITAATADQAGIANADWNVRWNWAKTTDSEVAFEIGESAASTGGTSTSGVPNQVITKLSTVAASTASPLSVYSRAAHVFSVSPTTAQIFATSGTASLPTYSFAAGTTTGMYFSATQLNFGVSGAVKGSISANGIRTHMNGSAATPAIGEFGSSGGIYFGIGVGFSVNGSEEGVLTGGVFRLPKGSGDAVSYALNFRKSRGTVGAPTVITTGDDLATMSGYGYVGATNTYQEACRITFDSTGTISDSTTGIGGIIAFSHATVGAEPVVVAQLKSQHLVHSGTAPTITAGGGTNPSIVGTDEACVVTVGTGGIATTVTVTFANAFTTNPPVCVAQSDTDLVAFKIVSTTTTVKVDATAPFTAGSKITIVSRGWE